MKELMNLEQFWDSLKEQNDNVRVEIEAADESIKIIKEIVNARIKMNLSQRELVIKLNNKIPQPSIAMWELNQREPSFESVVILAKFFNVSLDYLAGLTDFK